MTRIVPTQIVQYLENEFRDAKLNELATIHQKIGVIAGFCDLYAQLPQELIRLASQQYANLVASAATVKFGVDQYRQTRHPDALNFIGAALGRAWGHIKNLKDEVPSTSHDLTFIKDPILRDMIGVDMSAVTTDLQSGEWKGATVLAGSCCEALLLYGLQEKENTGPGLVAGAVAAIGWRGKQPNVNDLTDKSWDLFSYAETALQMTLILNGTKQEIDRARDYRNLIHPAKTIREKTRCDRGTAYVAVGALEHVISDLRSRL
jgi:hypothetical protein